jgi:predicted Ser/Thr protein kinase
MAVYFLDSLNDFELSKMNSVPWNVTDVLLLLPKKRFYSSKTIK